jgi:SAM-dependent methyltransferase
MDKEVAKKLMDLNYLFYEKIGKYWNNTSKYYSEGWEILWREFLGNQESPLTPLMKGGTGVPQSDEVVSKKQNFKVLDLGSGNGRFSTFLSEKFNGQKFSYYGVDFSDFLNGLAGERKEEIFEDFEIIKANLILDNWEEGLKNKAENGFDLITLFGVMHHIPTSELRLKLLQKATKLLSPNGILAFTTWNFKNIPRLQKRIIDLGSLEGQELLRSLNLEKEDFRQEDYILSWVKRETAYRYSHFYDDTEIFEYLDRLGLKLFDRYYADGRHSNRNEYFICKK